MKSVDGVQMFDVTSDPAGKKMRTVLAVVSCNLFLTVPFSAHGQEVFKVAVRAYESSHGEEIKLIDLNLPAREGFPLSFQSGNVKRIENIDVDLGASLLIRIKKADMGRILLDLRLEIAQDNASGPTNNLIIGKTVRLIDQLALHQRKKIVVSKDHAGKPILWIEVEVNKG